MRCRRGLCTAISADLRQAVNPIDMPEPLGNSCPALPVGVPCLVTGLAGAPYEQIRSWSYAQRVRQLIEVDPICSVAAAPIRMDPLVEFFTSRASYCLCLLHCRYWSGRLRVRSDRRPHHLPNHGTGGEGATAL